MKYVSFFSNNGEPPSKPNTNVSDSVKSTVKERWKNICGYETVIKCIMKYSAV